MFIIYRKNGFEGDQDQYYIKPFLNSMLHDKKNHTVFHPSSKSLSTYFAYTISFYFKLFIGLSENASYSIVDTNF